MQNGRQAFWESPSGGRHGALEQQGRAVNTHFAFLDLLSKGYGVLEASADELLVEYRSPESILTPSSPMRMLLRFRVVRRSSCADQAGAAARGGSWRSSGARPAPIRSTKLSQ